MGAGRPIKNNADWFTHDFDASDNFKTVYLESKFGLTGYAFYFKMLEILTRCDNFRFELNDITRSTYAKKIGISLDLFNEILTECIRPEIQAFVIDENGFLYSSGLIKRMQTLIRKREYDRKCYVNETEIPTENTISDNENTNFRNRKYVVKKSIVKNINNIPPNPVNGASDDVKVDKKKSTEELVQAGLKAEDKDFINGKTCADWFRTLLPPERTVIDKDIANWIKTFVDLVRIDKRDPKEIAKVCKYARDDPFWKDNFFSMTKLREKDRQGMKYYEVFLIKMKSGQERARSGTNGIQDDAPHVEYRKPTDEDRKNMEKLYNKIDAARNNEYNTPA